MAELGNKHECHSCGAKFYDLGRPATTCPKCGASPQDTKRQEASEESAHAKRRRRRETPPKDVESETDEDAGDGDDFAEDELITPDEGSEGEDDEDEDEDDD